MITAKSRAEIAKMRSAGRIVAEVLAIMESELKPGISTADLDRLAEQHIRAAGAVPSFLNYLGGRRYDPRDPNRYPASMGQKALRHHERPSQAGLLDMARSRVSRRR